MSNKQWIPYHMHTEDSLLDSCTKAQEYINLAVRDGLKAISFSEHGKPLQWTEKWDACKKAGLRYMHSVEIYLTEHLEPKVRDNYHTVLIAKNEAGRKELNQLVYISTQPDHMYYNNRLSFDEFLNISDNIITTSACLASPLNKLPETHPRYDELVQKYDFLEIQPHNCKAQYDFNQRLWGMSKKFNKPLIVGTDTHSSTPYKAECRAVLTEAKRKPYDDEDALDLSYKTYDEIIEMFRQQGALPPEVYTQALDNTNLLYDMTEDIELDLSIKYPILYGSREADAAKFTEVVEQKFQSKLKSGVIPLFQQSLFRKAIDEEMRVFRKLKMMGFMLSMSELISWCREQGMAIGTARGSVGGSRVAYVADIIDLNPETWHTVFSRFCNEHRAEIGDIDIDCVESDRPAIFKHIIERFGIDKTARVASFGTIQSKGVIDDVGRALSIRWEKAHPKASAVQGAKSNPWSLDKIEQIKSEFEADEGKTRAKYPELFYYYDGLLGTKISQSVHPAGMVISPITLDDNYGTFYKDGEICLVLDMDNVHDFTGLAKYDFLILKTVQVIRDTCRYLNKPYPKTHEINWDDDAVWSDMIKNPTGVFQFEGNFAFDCLKKFKPKSIFDMSLVTACIRPSGASYRDELLARIPHHNPSKMIDDLLKDGYGRLIYQEDIIAFLQEICGLSGGDADNIRRAIARKQKERLDAAMPDILNGYCNKSDKPRAEAEQEAKEFLKIIEDASSYMFGKNHSIAYCLLGYLCAYYRYYYPLEFLTAFLNNAANESDIKTGTAYAEKLGIKVEMPRWGHSRSGYFFDKNQNTISKGVASIKYMSADIADELYDLSREGEYPYFMMVMRALKHTALDTRQLGILIQIDYFSDYGNQRELLRLSDIYNNILYSKSSRSEVSRIAKDKVDGTIFESVVRDYSSDKTKAGAPAKSYTILNMDAILRGVESAVKELHLKDLDDLVKVQNFTDVMGYVGYVSGKDEDRKKLYVTATYPLCRKKGGKQFGYSVLTKSIGSGKEGRFTVFNKIYNEAPIQKGDIIYCKSFARDGKYFQLTSYDKIS